MNGIFSQAGALLRNLFRLEPVDHAWWEHWIFRVGLAYLLLTNTPLMEFHRSAAPLYDSLPKASGIAQWWPGITCLSDPSVFHVVRMCFWGALGLYVCGVAAPIALTYIFLVDISLGSLTASQGAHGHSRQTMDLLVMGLMMASWAGVFLKQRGGMLNMLWWTTPAQNLAVNWGRQMMMAAYAVSAVTKELNSDGFWFTKTESFVLAVIKAQEEANLKGMTPISPEAAGFAQWMLGHPLIAGGMLLGAWLLEICAPLALLNRRIALLMGILYWFFHWMNGWFMGLGFPLNRWLITLFFINAAFWVVWAFKKFFIKPEPISS
jgi:hypothetical protein